MHFRLALLLFGLALVVAAPSESFIVPADRKATKGFDELNEFLVSQDKADARHAASTLVTIVTPTPCDYKTLDALGYVISARFDVLMTIKRMGFLFGGAFREWRPGSLVVGCHRFVESQFEELRPQLPKFPLKSNEALEADRVNFILHSQEKLFRDLYVVLAYDDLVELAKSDPENNFYDWKIDETTGASEPIRNSENIRKAFVKYLLVPCLEYNDMTSKLFDAVSALVDFLRLADPTGRVYLSGRSLEFQEAMYHNKRCRIVATMSDGDIEAPDGVQLHKSQVGA